MTNTLVQKIYMYVEYWTHEGDKVDSWDVRDWILIFFAFSVLVRQRVQE